MVVRWKKRGFTLVELLVVIAIIGSLVAMLFPAIQQVRETARRSSCANNMKQMGTALQNYESSYRRLPSSCMVSRTKTGNTPQETWSWLVQLLPYSDAKVLYDSLTVRRGVPWEEQTPPSVAGAKGPHQTVRETVMISLICPSNSGARDYEGPMLPGESGANPVTSIKAALTNYKALGGIQKESLPFKILNALSKPAPKPPYGTDTSMFPEGVLYGGTDGTRLAEILDGQTNTIIAAETIEPRYSRWILGTESTLAALPSADDPNIPVKILRVTSITPNIYAPEGFDGNFDAQSALQNVKSYMDYDYRPDANSYDAKRQIKYGVSSNHNGQSNHLFADGAVRTIQNNIDPAMYMFLVTKAGNEIYTSSFFHD